MIRSNILKPLHPNLINTSKEKEGRLSQVSGFYRFTLRLTGLIFSVLSMTFILSSPATAHRGATGEVDTCRISVGDEVVHFSA